MLQKVMLYESLCWAVKCALANKRNATSKRERQAHLRALVSLIDAVDEFFAS